MNKKSIVSICLAFLLAFAFTAAPIAGDYSNQISPLCDMEDYDIVAN